MSFATNGTIGEGAADREAYWDLREGENGVVLEIFGSDGCTCRLRRGRDGVWRGRWLRFERMPVELTPQPVSVGMTPLAKDEGGRMKDEMERRAASPQNTSKVSAECDKLVTSFIPHPSSFSTRLPRLIHQIWLGPSPLPEKFKVWSEGWRGHHPGWHHQIWRDADADVFPMVNREAYIAAESPAMKADIFRYEVLLRHGGLYADLDFECLRPLDPLLDQVGEEAFGGFEWPTVNHSNSLCNALLGALPGSAFLQRVAAELPGNLRAFAAECGTHGEEFISRATGPAFLTWVAATLPRITIFPQPVLYPRPHQRNTAYARHHFAGSWRETNKRHPLVTTR